MHPLIGTDIDLHPLHPLHNSTSPIASQGIILGRQYNGQPFCFDPYLLKSKGYLNSLCFCLLGLKGNGKSSLMKLFAMRYSLYMNHMAGRSLRFGAVNHKTTLGVPEYQGLADVMGGRVVSLRDARINILDPAMHLGIDEDMQILRQVFMQIRSSSSSGGGWFNSTESAVLSRAVEVLRDSTGEQSLVGLMQVLNEPGNVHPRLPTGEPMDITAEELRQIASELNMVLLRMHGSDFGNTFGGDASLVSYLEDPMVVFDYTGLSKQSVSLFQTVIWSQRAAASRHADTRYRTDVSIDDENHELAKDPVYVEFMSAHVKKVRMDGGILFFITHRLEDYEATRNDEVINMIGDMDGYFIGRMGPIEAASLQERLQLSDKTTERLTHLPPHHFCFIVRGYPEVFFIQSPGTPLERTVCETDYAHAGITGDSVSF